MPKRKKEGDKPPSKAYLLSFGDTMTALLAFFIVLLSLSEEQTGANLHSGTGSFVNAMKSFGLPGKLSGGGSSNAISRAAPMPLYIAPDPENNPAEAEGTGPDEDDDGQRIIDREKDDFGRFMTEMDRLFSVERQPDTRGETVFDYFNKLGAEGQLLGDDYREAVQRILPLLYSDRYQVQVIVWATTPSPTAWPRAARQSLQITQEIAQLGQLSQQQRQRLSGVGRAWIDSDAKRPVLSFVVRKVSPPSKTPRPE